jgi:16S rRNA (cytosine967-C5)-methyltransferase
VPLPARFHADVRRCVADIVEHGRHLSSAIEQFFRAYRPGALDASAIRTAIFTAVRYGDVEGAISGRYEDGPHPEAASIPVPLRERIARAYGDRAHDVVSALLTDAPTFIRVNTLRTTAEACAAALLPFRPHRCGQDVYRIDAPYGLFATDAFAAGWFEQQDITSQRAGNELRAAAGQRIVDACAGAGGKTLLFASAMRNKGRIIALDTDAAKLDALRTRCVRAGVDIVETRHITTTKVVKRLAGTADGVFIDVPCTGTGVIRRNPDILLRFSEDSFAELCAMQAEILRRNARIAKPGAPVVYATCSILPEEGRDQVHSFLASADGAAFRLENEWQTLPGDDGGDGFYVARLTRSSDA